MVLFICFKRVEDESTTSDLVKVSRERLLQVDTLPITNQVHRSGKLKRMSDTPTGARLYSTRSFSNPVRVLSRARSAHLERVSSRSRSEQVQSEKKKERKKGECELEKTTSRYEMFIQKRKKLRYRLVCTWVRAWWCSWARGVCGFVRRAFFFFICVFF